MPAPAHRATWLPSALVLLVLAALAATCFARLVAAPGTVLVDGARPSIDYANRGSARPLGNDLTFVFLPHHWSIGRRFQEFGHWPLWDARGFAGRPLVGNPQAGLFYPPVWLFWWLMVPSALGWLTVGHLVWGGLGAYALARSMCIGRWSALIAASVFQASPLLLAHTFEGHCPHVWAVSWCPWAFWAYRAHRGGRALGRWALPAVLALVFFAGHPQEWLLLVLALSFQAAFDAFRDFRRARRDGPAAARRALTVSLASWSVLVGLSLGMAALDLAPQWAARPWLRRDRDRGLAVEAEAHRHYHLSPLNLFQLLEPAALGGPADYFGDDNYWETVFSIGLVPLLLAIVGAKRGGDHRAARGWLILLAFSIAFAAGRSLGLFSLAHALGPGMSGFRVPARALFLANLAAAVLAGMGAEALQNALSGPGPDAWKRFARRSLLASMVLLIGLLAVRFFGGPPARVSPPGPRDKRSTPLRPPAIGRPALAAERVLRSHEFPIALAGMLALIVLGRRSRTDNGRRAAARLIGVLAMIELAWSGFSLIQAAPPERFLGPDLSPLGVAPPIARVKARDAFYGDWPASAAGLEKININDGFQLDHATALYETLYPLASRRRPMAERRLSPEARAAWRRIRRAVLDRLSVTHLVSDRVEPEPPWPVVGATNWAGSHVVVQRNPSALPRGYVVPRATVLPNNAAVVLTSLPDLDAHESVVMAFDPLAAVPDAPRQAFQPADWTAFDPDRPTFQVATSAPGLLVVASTWMPGWTAAVDGGPPAPVLRGNLAQCVVPLPRPGRHTIVLNYQPPGWAFGRAVAGASFAAWLAWGAFTIAGRRPRLNAAKARAATPPPAAAATASRTRGRIGRQGRFISNRASAARQ